MLPPIDQRGFGFGERVRRRTADPSVAAHLFDQGTLLLGSFLQLPDALARQVDMSS